MIRSKQGKISNTNKATNVSSQGIRENKKFDAVLKNYKCLFCKTSYYFDDIYSSKCACGSQWFEKLQGFQARQLECV
tara:strand:+ start:816 stop:1046 length:231 start_codon:yes stop_codon:yes gene_type:complete